MNDTDFPQIQVYDNVDEPEDEVETEETDDGILTVNDTIEQFLIIQEDDLLEEEEVVFHPDPEEETGTDAPPKEEVDWEARTLDVLHLVVDEGTTQKRIDQLVKLNQLTDTRKKTLVKQLQGGIVDAKGKDVTKTIGNSYKRLIEPATGKPMERSAFFFDKLYLGQDVFHPPMQDDGQGGKKRQKDEDGNDLLSGMEATDLILKRGRDILAAGGSYRDVEKLIDKTGIPRDWWPDELLEEMQPWRKTRSVLQDQKLEKQFEEKQKKKESVIKPDDILSVLQIVGEDAPSEMSEIAELFKDNAFAENFGLQLSVINEVAGLGDFSAVLQLLQTDDDDGIEKTKSGKREEAFDKGVEGVEVLGGALSNILDLVNNSQTLSEEAVSFFTDKLLPGVALANCGIDLIQVGKAIVKHKISKGQAKELQEIAKASRGSGGSRDKGKELAFSNDKGAMKIAMAKDGVKLFTTLLEGAGELAGLLGAAPGAGAKVGLSIGATVITLGSKAVFTRINWGEAKKAREMLQQARAGNPVARVQIFKQSNLYAKAYLVTLAKDGDPLAVQFIVNKGIDEKALSNKAISTRILTEALLKLSGQTSEEDVSESLLEEMAGRLGKVFEGLKDKVKASGFKPYDPGWTPPEAQILSTQWSEVKRDAVAHGLLDIGTGIGSAMGDAEKLCAIAGKAIAFRDEKTFSPLSKEGKEHRTALLDARDSLGKLESKVLAFYPMTVPLAKDGKTPDQNGKPAAHKGMTLYMDGLLDKIRKAADSMTDDLEASGLMKADWAPTGDDRLKPSTFADNWISASIYACLPEDDFGTKGKLTTLDLNWKEFQKAKTGTDGKVTRKAAIAVIDAFKDLAPAIESCRIAAGAVPNMQKYLLATLLDAMDQRREAEDAVNPKLFRLRAARPLTASGWNTEFERAIAESFASSKAPYDKVTDAITDLETGLKAALAEKDAAKQLVLIKAHAIAIATLQDRLEAVSGAVPPLETLVNEDIIAPARAQQKAWSETRAKKPFTPKDGLGAGDWESTYNAAVAAGAVPEAKRPMNALKDALKDRTKASDAFGKAWNANPKPWQDARKKAKVAHEATEAAISAAKRMLHWDEFDHEVMQNYLQDTLIAKLEKLVAKDSDIKKALAGNTQAKSPGDFTPEPKAFGEVVAEAVKNGLLDNPNTKEFNVAYYLAELNRNVDISIDSKQWKFIQEGALKNAERLTAQLFGLVQKLESQTLHPDFKTYFGQAKTWAQKAHKDAKEEIASRKKQPQPKQTPQKEKEPVN